jgi:hypothetical protein
MLREGPIPRFVHGVLEYLAGAGLIAAPFVLSFTDVGAATAASIVAGVGLIALAASTRGPTSLIDSVPIAAHVVIDYLVAAALIAAPFVLGFSGEGAPTALFIALGVVHLLVTIGTRFERERPVRRRRRRGARRESADERDAAAAGEDGGDSGDLWEDSPPREPLSRPPPSREG